MLIKESLTSAIISIRSNATRSFLTSLAIIIGTAAVIAVIGLGSSAEKALEESIDDLIDWDDLVKDVKRFEKNSTFDICGPQTQIGIRG